MENFDRVLSARKKSRARLLDRTNNKIKEAAEKKEQLEIEYREKAM